MVESAAGPELPEVLGEEVERDEGDDQHAGAGDHEAGLGAAVDHPAHHDHDPDGLEGGDEQQRDPGDPGAGELGAVDSAERGQQPGAGRQRGGRFVVGPRSGAWGGRSRRLWGNHAHAVIQPFLVFVLCAVPLGRPRRRALFHAVTGPFMP